MPPVISAVIPSYNGKDLLELCLPALIASLAGQEHEVIVVDDGSRDGTADWLSAAYPQVKIAQGQRRGFAAACNLGIAAATGRYLLLLNNDMVLAPGTAMQLLTRLESNNYYFAVGGAYQTPLPGGGYRCAFCGNTHPKGYEHPPGVRPALDAPVAGGLFRADLWHRLGGLDERFTPFYWEDVDLGWNAWRAGYGIAFDAQAVMVHRHGATIHRTYRPAYYQAVRWKNMYVFTWKNANREMLRRHLVRIPWRGLRAIGGRYALSWLWGLTMALGAAPAAWAARRARPPAAVDEATILARALPDPELLLRQLY